MAKPKKSITELIADANNRPDGADPVEIEETEAPQVETPTPAGLMRVRILMGEHTDGRLKKTWKQNSVIEIDQYTAQRMIDRNWAAPTTAPINEMLVAYKGK